MSFRILLFTSVSSVGWLWADSLVGLFSLSDGDVLWLNLCDVLGLVLKLGDILGLVLSRVLGGVLSGVLDLGGVLRLSYVFGNNLGSVLGLVLRLVLRLVERGWNDLRLVLRGVNWNLERRKQK